MEIVYIIYLLFYFMKNSPPPLSKKKNHTKRVNLHICIMHLNFFLTNYKFRQN